MILHKFILHLASLYIFTKILVKAQCPASWVTIGDSCYMNLSVLQNHSDAQHLCDTNFTGSKLAVLETDSETDDVFKLLRLTSETRYAIGPFLPCDNDECYFVIGRASGVYQVGSVPCDTTLPFICEGEPFYEEPKQIESVDPPSTTSGSVTISWERPDNVSSYRVTLEKYQSDRQAETRHIDAEDPREVTFDGLDGGTQYRAAIYSVNGPKESDPYILDFCTIPSQVTCVQHVIQKNLLVLYWTPSPGRVHHYRIEINATDKEGRMFDPVYTGRTQQAFDKVCTTTNYSATAQAVVLFNGQEISSNTYVHPIVRDPNVPVSKEDVSEPCENVPDFVRKPPSPVPNDAENVTISNIATDSLTANWTSRRNASSFHVTAVDIDGHAPNTKQYIGAGEPKLAVFDSLQGGTEYTVAVFTFNGSMDSDPVTLTVATLPMQIPVIYAKVKAGEIKVTWDDVPGNVDDYFFELVDAVDKESKPIMPVYAGDKGEIKFDKLEKETNYSIEANAVLWFKATRLISASRTLIVTTPTSGDRYFDSQSVTQLPTLSPLIQAMTRPTAAPVLFCPQINYESTTTKVSASTDLIMTDLTTQTTTAQQTRKETTQPSTTQVQPTTAHVPSTTALIMADLTTQTTTEQRTTKETTQPSTTQVEPTTTHVPSTTVLIMADLTTQTTTEQQTTKETTQPSTTQVEPTTTHVPSTTVLIMVDLTPQTTTEKQTTKETTQPSTTQVEPITTHVPSTTVLITSTDLTTQTETRQQTTQQQVTTPQTSQEHTTLQKTTMKPTTKYTTPQETTTAKVTTKLNSTLAGCKNIFHEPFATEGMNSTLLFTRQTTAIDFINSTVTLFANQLEEDNPYLDNGTHDEIANIWRCSYGTKFTTEREVKFVPDLLEALLQGFLTSAKWAPTTQVKGHPFAGGTDVEIWKPENPVLEGCGNYSRVHEEPSWSTFDVPNSAISINGTVCRSLLVMKMQKVDELLPQNGCSDEGEFQCAELETPFPLVTVALVPAKPPPFTEPITLQFQLQNEIRGSIPVCVWLETKLQASSESLLRYSWNSSGCNTLTEKGAILCQCYHLTSFSVIMRVADYEMEEGHKRALHIISMLGCILTIISACLTIAVFVYLRLMKEERLIHTQLLVAICLSQLIFFIGIDQTENQVFCTVISIALFYFMSATFTWMLVESCHLYLSVVRVFSSGSRLKEYSLAGWALPLIQVVITSAVGISSGNMTNAQYCWLSVHSGIIWGFAGPVLIIIAVNTVMLVTVLREINRIIDRDITKMKANKFRTNAKAFLVFMPMAGLPWFFGFIALNTGLVIFDYIFSALNSFQGVILFGIFIIGNKEVRGKIGGRINDVNALGKHPADVTTATTKGGMKDCVRMTSSYTSPGTSFGTSNTTCDRSPSM